MRDKFFEDRFWCQYTLLPLLISEVSISNTGCDTVIIFSGKIIGAGFALYGVSFPILLEPGKLINVPILSVADTTGHKQGSDAVLSFESNSTTPLPSVQLQRRNIYPRQYKMAIGNEIKNGMPGDTIQIRFYAPDDLQGVSSLDLDI